MENIQRVDVVDVNKLVMVCVVIANHRESRRTPKAEDRATPWAEDDTIVIL